VSKEEGPLKIAGHTVERFQAGRHMLGRIEFNDEITVVFQIKNGDSGPDVGGVRCLTCKISKIGACAELIGCRDIKANDPNASCREEILECLALACRDSCKSEFGGGGDILIL
jgi:hypothetical protein